MQLRGVEGFVAANSYAKEIGFIRDFCKEIWIEIRKGIRKGIRLVITSIRSFLPDFWIGIRIE